MWPFTRGRGHTWTSAPAKPIRYSLFQRIADRRTGRRDGRSGIPVVPADLLSAGGTDGSPPPVFDTGRLKELTARYRGAVTAVDATFQRFCEEQAEARNAAFAKLKLAESRLARAQAAYDEAAEPLTHEQLNTRRITESPLSDVHVRQRRRGEYDRARQAAAEQFDAAQQEFQDATAALRTIDMMIDGSRERAAGQARRLHWHAQRRAQVYWQHLVRVHPHGDVLNGRIEPAEPERPDWAMKDGAPPDPLRPAGHRKDPPHGRPTAA